MNKISYELSPKTPGSIPFLSDILKFVILPLQPDYIP